MTDTTVADASSSVSGASGGLAYRVLARKYRPKSFAELIGQDALVRTLTNAIHSGRIAQAFMLTGVRGVGKTTTARIIARALNCTGPDGTGGPTVTPCGVCDNCRAIAEDRHVDVMEMDAASHTGVDDIREIIDGVRYAPVSARYKLYIIDEVHMLSKSAFNALLKTLEEPPAHVKFVFATTEIRKVPVTVLSRCQRFDLRRVDAQVLKEHFTRITGLEGAGIEPDAASLIARAADGSVRDGLSLLDQAIALAAGTVTAQQVRDMLGLADRSKVIDLFEAAVSAKPAEAMDLLSDLHRVGADPVVILQDLLDLVHNLTRLKVVPDSANDPGLPEAERTRGAALSAKLGMPALTRAWQLLLKGLGEVQAAPVPQQALEMVIVRLSYAADMPTPGDLIRQFQNLQNGGGQGGQSGGGAPRGPGGGPVAVGGSAVRAVAHQAQPSQQPSPQPVQTVAVAVAVADEERVAMPRDFRTLVQVFAEKREGALYGHLTGSVHLVRLEPGRLELRLTTLAPSTLPNRVGQLLTEWTGQRWVVIVSDAPGEPTLIQQEQAAQRRALEEAEAHPVVRAVLDAFPGAKITDVRDLKAAVEAEPQVADDGENPDLMVMQQDDGVYYPLDDEGDF
ncbi:DNA polymerase III subunit gamma/tau [Azospirillum brasilense]|uniref:DNA polymerase III subunit gamma/tau n=1 Tax=Azospirillum brasilense TaxID=192 RepID=A0A0P0EZ66_AZOBR|nr:MULTISPECIES: DNA polymerase III subunit gamma/tau [Azospirillum]ALJ36062.1 DNA polymerase III subunit gamma/tau [Azospirillum brasilense]MDW7552481.1 DNA polymerase III subunit gamma/tau [Azospirillum brasilense]MDW7592329.1 DNA polymerase III subunit gamma/tau [Azospirillum brasilense]MDW7627459.1 DNA polymerase III subunit gamma/tau [Azospirillum brasilense]MDW7628976.1 DNA polymerase III subunit gamma/tau [Azospirillum brasilense]